MNLEQQKEKEEVAAYLETVTEWKTFLSDEYFKILSKQSRNLGGQKPKRGMDDDDNENSFEVNIDSIMTRFSNFTSSMQNHHQSESFNQGQDDDDDKKDDYDPFDRNKAF